MNNIIEFYTKPYKNYINFKGRTRRLEYWMFILINVVIIMTLGFLGAYFEENHQSDIFFSIFAIYFLFNMVPFLALIVRRLHDMGKSGWYWFVRFIPVIGPIWLLIMLCTDSEHGPNKWGNNPKGIGNATEIDSIGLE